MTTQAPAYASPADVAAHGPYGPGRTDRPGPRYPFQGRISADGSGGHPAEPGRYHVYASYTCPWAQRAVIVRDLAGLREVVSVSYVDDDRDARGWAFRERRGPDPVNGFTLLAEAYDATEPGYPGHISVPVLWDRRTRRIVSNDFARIPVDLGTGFAEWATENLYPEDLRAEIEAQDEEIARDLSQGVHLVAGAATQEEYERRRAGVAAALDRLDARLATRPLPDPRVPRDHRLRRVPARRQARPAGRRSGADRGRATRGRLGRAARTRGARGGARVTEVSWGSPSRCRDSGRTCTERSSRRRPRRGRPRTPCRTC
ncbi:hypothetical protein [Microbispora sp. H10836]|uniref:hypothetical protein n=1 Tax=Microbispora sp. H10836 TaxID=2729106 RepID=UPI001B8C1990|nr:hypothetical protein [Microbispora sp. H10836]